jgi:hypothetical protein
MKYLSLIIFFTVSTHYLSAQESFSQQIGYGGSAYTVPIGKTLLIHTADGADRKILINGGTYYQLTQNSTSFNSPIVAKSGSTVSVASSGGFPSSSNITGLLTNEDIGFSQGIGTGTAAYIVPAGKTLLIHTADGADRKISIGGAVFNLTTSSTSFNSPIVAKSGSTVSVTSSGGFPSSSNITGLLKSENLSSSDAENKSSNTLTIFPNPATNYLFIQYDRIKINEIQIVSTTGKTIRTFELSLSNINISDIPNGIYFVKLFTDQKVITQKIVKY